MGADWTIRRASEADAEAMGAFASEIQQVEFDLVGAPVLPATQVSAVIRGVIERALTQPDAAAFVAESGGSLAGYALGFLAGEDDPLIEASFRRYGQLVDLYVAPAMRGRGVARALIDAFAAVMRDKGAAWMRVNAKAANRGAIDTYLACGFSPYETVFAKKIA